VAGRGSVGDGRPSAAETGSAHRSHLELDSGRDEDGGGRGGLNVVTRATSGRKAAGTLAGHEVGPGAWRSLLHPAASAAAAGADAVLASGPLIDTAASLPPYETTRPTSVLGGHGVAGAWMRGEVEEVAAANTASIVSVLLAAASDVDAASQPDWPLITGHHCNSSSSCRSSSNHGSSGSSGDGCDALRGICTGNSSSVVKGRPSRG